MELHRNPQPQTVIPRTMLSEYSPLQPPYLKRRYVTASTGNFDIYVAFAERGLSLLNRLGKLGFILPSKFLTTDYGLSLRQLISHANTLEDLVDFGHDQVFENATTYTCLLFLRKLAGDTFRYVLTSPKALDRANAASRELESESLDSESWLFATDDVSDLLLKIAECSTTLLGMPAEMSRGTSTGADDVYCLIAGEDGLTTRDGEPIEIEQELLRRPIYATDFTRFHFRPANSERILFPYDVWKDGYDVMSEEKLRREFPMAYKYLRAHRSRLEARKQWKVWYGYSAPRSLHVHVNADLVVPLLADRGLAAPLPQPSEDYCLMASGGFSVSLRTDDDRSRYVLGLVNSKLLYWNLALISNKFRGGWITCTKQYFGTLPIRRLNSRGLTRR
jgi:hypothetical protein